MHKAPLAALAAAAVAVPGAVVAVSAAADAPAPSPSLPAPFEPGPRGATARVERGAHAVVREIAPPRAAAPRAAPPRRAAPRRARRAHRFARVPGGPSRATLDAIASCESGGNPTAVGGGGAFRGKYQFDRGTWASVGGGGDPAAAPEAEQDYRAALLYARSGSSPWPVCGR